MIRIALLALLLTGCAINRPCLEYGLEHIPNTTIIPGHGSYTVWELGTVCKRFGDADEG